MDTVFIRNLALTTIVGVHAWERDTPRTVILAIYTRQLSVLSWQLSVRGCSFRAIPYGETQKPRATGMTGEPSRAEAAP
jgi:hypothetical protein